ncbi:hypothetical protein [Arthrobacter sp. ISL-30]|uniref:hypothetical protein n=1 Tax=Arthrobacter sp. ISL-30 TaxID=2819109 RepID=UPI001BEB7606|nr:hypothetical protein [Arthrobacter sp. ISL-30]MBT2513166.1 hypothetical protein [Arthrobacter sp. ISL-30]
MTPSEPLEDFTKHVDDAVRTQLTADLACQAVLDLAPADSTADDVTALIARRLPNRADRRR